RPLTKLLAEGKVAGGCAMLSRPPAVTASRQTPPGAAKACHPPLASPWARTDLAGHLFAGPPQQKEEHAMVEKGQDIRPPGSAGAGESATEGVNSISPVGTPEGGAAAGNLTGASPGEGIPDGEAVEPSGTG